MNALVPKNTQDPKVVSDITKPNVLSLLMSISRPSPTSTDYLAEGFGILFFPASLNDEALTCLEWMGLS